MDRFNVSDERQGAAILVSGDNEDGWLELIPNGHRPSSVDTNNGDANADEDLCHQTHGIEIVFISENLKSWDAKI